MVVLSSFIAFSCAGVELQHASSEDTEAAYRAIIANHPDSEESDEARARLEELAFQRARQGDDIASYNRFLVEFPEGDFAREAIERRAELRLDRLIDEADVGSLRRFLAIDHGTEASKRARVQLERLEATQAKSSDDVEVLKAYLLAHPESESRRGIERRLDDIEFQRAKTSNKIDSFRDYLRDHERGIHRAETTELLETVEADQAIANGEIEALERFLREHPGSASEARVRASLATLLVERAEVLLDPAIAERALELEPDAPVAERAETILKATKRDHRRLAKVRSLVTDLAGPMELRDTEALRIALGSDRPEDRWNAVREVALSTNPDVIDVAVEAAGSGDPMLLFLARAALSAWTDTRAELSGPPLKRWRQRLRRRSSNPEDLLRLGAISEALGEPSAALQAYRSAAQHQATALAATTQRALLTAEHGSQRERAEALDDALDGSRARLEEVLDTIPEQLTPEQSLSTLQLLGGLHSLERLGEAITNAFQLTPIAHGALEQGESAVEAELDEALANPTLADLRRVVAAAAAARRRLEGRLARVAPESIAAPTESLTERAAERRQRRVTAARTLGELRAQEAVPALLEVASRGDGEVSREALSALVSIGSTAARSGLVELSRRPNQPESQAQELLRTLRTLRARRATASQHAEIDDAIRMLEGRPSQDRSLEND